MENAMLRFRSWALSLLVFACVLPAKAQFYKLHEADVSVGGTGQLTTAVTEGNGNHQRTTDSTGLLLSLRDHPLAWAGVEVNYGYNRFTEDFITKGDQIHARVPVNVHELSGAYMFHPHFLHLQPFVNIGGGALDFVPTARPGDQWRGIGLTEVGFDVPTSNPHFGFRVQGRALIYRAPSFDISAVATQKWVVTTEPSLSAYIRF
jgi:hypothetical protein